MPSNGPTAALRELLLAPGAFFEERTPRQGVAGWVVAAVAVGHAVVFLGGFLLVAVQIAVLSPEIGVAEALQSFLAQGFVPAAGLSVLVLVNWLVVSAVLHVPVKLRHGDGTFGDTLFVVAWSAPVALLLPVGVILALLLAIQGAGSPEQFLRQADAFRGAFDGLGFVATLVVLCWQGYIWTGGLQRTHDMDDGAILPVAVTIVLGVLATLGGS
jgi:hypothetical protein